MYLQSSGFCDIDDQTLSDVVHCIQQSHRDEGHTQGRISEIFPTELAATKKRNDRQTGLTNASQTSNGGILGATGMGRHREMLLDI